MISGEITLRPRYGEVDQMGYVYHANYVSYCHEARTELLRQFGICDSILEERNIMLPVIDFTIRYKKPATYDEKLNVKVTIKTFPDVRFHFQFQVRNEQRDLICEASSTVVFVDKDTRMPVRLPECVEEALKHEFDKA